MDWNEVDINMRFLLAKPIEISGIGTLKPLTIDEITKIGFNTYNQYISLLCLSNEDICEMLSLEDDRVIEPFDFIVANCISGDTQFRDQIMEALSLFFGEEISFHETYFSIGDIYNNNTLKKENYNFFVDVLKRMNCISDKNKIDKTKIKTEAEKSFWLKLKEMKAKYKKDEESPNMSDIISSVCCKHPSINLFNIGGLTIYQLINNFMRLNTINEYDISISSLLQGADSKSVNLKHWSSKLKIN